MKKEVIKSFERNYIYVFDSIKYNEKTDLIICTMTYGYILSGHILKTIEKFCNKNKLYYYINANDNKQLEVILHR